MKKGFTLIELLAVIVILAIIALISVPMILGVIDKAKLGALEDSGYGLIDAANLYYSENVQNLTDKVVFDFEGGKQISDSKLKYKGNVDNGKLILNTNGKIVVCIDNGINYAYKNLSETKITTGKGTCSYNGDTGDFTIVSDVDTLNQQINSLNKQVEKLNSKINDLEKEISTGKTSIANALTAKGAETLDTLSFEVMANNIATLKLGKEFVSLGSATTFDLSKYENCGSFTNDNFIITFSGTKSNKGGSYRITDGESYWASGASVLNKSYNASTCKLSASATVSSTIGHYNNWSGGCGSSTSSVNAYLVY